MNSLFSSRRFISAIFIGASIAVTAWAAPPSVDAIITSPLRDADRASDAARKPAEFLALAQPNPGMRALDISAGGGYTSQLLALAVGPTGTVWAQEDKPSKSMQQRLDLHPQSNLIFSVAPYDHPVPADAMQLDLITIVLAYHDISYLPIDRIAMDRLLFAALKPGGHLIVIDHTARAGSGIADAKTLHRIDEQTVRDDFTSVGFVLESQSDYLRNPADPRDQPFFKTTIATDKFAFRFVKAP